MKYFSIFIATLLTTSVFAQTNTFPSSGNVGIGTTSPSSKLEVYTSSGNAATGIVVSQGNSSGNIHSGRLFFTNTGEASNSFALMKSGDRFGIRSEATPGSSSGIERVSILKNGKVGIGTASPNRKLDVMGTIFARTASTHNVDAEQIRIGRIDYDDIRYHSIHSQHSGNSSANYLKFKLHDGETTTSQSTVLALHGNGEVIVAGTVRSREVIVEENTGADFVFEEGYELPDLSELENYIKANKHLPEIPTAGQMKEEGVKVGDLQMKLLQKIEELTLHVIEQKKSIDHLTETIEKQQEEITRLKGKNNEE